MRRSLISAALAMTAGVLIAGGALAQPRIQQQPSAPPAQGGPGGGPAQQSGGGALLPGTNADITAQVLKVAGYQNVEIITLQSGRHVKGQVHGQNVGFIHQNCEGNVCKSATFMAQYGAQQGVDVNWVNAWNVEKRYAKLSMAKDGSLTFEYDIHFYGEGVSPANFRDSAVLFGAMIKSLLEFQPKK